MTLFLASVRNAAEAMIAVDGGADIVDLKDPSQGVLGAVSPEETRNILAALGAAATVSVTIGDIPFRAEISGPAIEAAIDRGARYIKIGLFEEDASGCRDIFHAASKKARLIAVIFADLVQAESPLLYHLLDTLADLGFYGVMADTVKKGGGGLQAYWPAAFCKAFIDEARRRSLFGGLAGSLLKEDIPALLSAGPSVLGFRGALCLGERDGDIDRGLVSQIRAAIPFGTQRRDAAFLLHSRPHAA